MDNRQSTQDNRYSTFEPKANGLLKGVGFEYELDHRLIKEKRNLWLVNDLFRKQEALDNHRNARRLHIKNDEINYRVVLKFVERSELGRKRLEAEERLTEKCANQASPGAGHILRPLRTVYEDKCFIVEREEGRDRLVQLRHDAFVVFEYLENAITLKNIVDKHVNAAGVALAKEYAPILFSLLDTLEAANVIHRDISPSNLMLDNKGHLWLIDFERAILFPDERIEDDSDLEGKGTPGFVAPECESANELTPAVDQYSVGMILLMLLTGKQPELLRIHPSSLLKDIPQDLQPILLRATAKSPGERYASAAEFKSAWNGVFIARERAAVEAGTQKLVKEMESLSGKIETLQSQHLETKTQRDQQAGELEALKEALHAAVKELEQQREANKKLQIEAEKNAEDARRAKIAAENNKQIPEPAPKPDANRATINNAARNHAPNEQSADASTAKSNAKNTWFNTALMVGMFYWGWLVLPEYLPEWIRGLPSPIYEHFVKPLPMFDTNREFELVMVTIPAGSFIMGDDKSTFSDEKPAHRVSIKSFKMMTKELTRGEFAQFVVSSGYKTDAEQKLELKGCAFNYRGDGRKWKEGISWRTLGLSQTDSHPVVCVSHNDAVAYATWLSQQTGKRYRLPTEAEWEFAARAGTTTDFSFGASIGENEVNCFGCDSHPYKKSTTVGSFKANAFGLYDMHGNVWEWVQDCYHDSYKATPAAVVNDGAAWEDGSNGACNSGNRVLRGGSWFNDLLELRSAKRAWIAPSYRSHLVGFRLVQDI